MHFLFWEALLLLTIDGLQLLPSASSLLRTSKIKFERVSDASRLALEPAMALVSSFYLLHLSFTWYGNKCRISVAPYFRFTWCLFV